MPQPIECWPDHVVARRGRKFAKLRERFADIGKAFQQFAESGAADTLEVAKVDRDELELQFIGRTRLIRISLADSGELRGKMEAAWISSDNDRIDWKPTVVIAFDEFGNVGDLLTTSDDERYWGAFHNDMEYILRALLTA